MLKVGDPAPDFSAVATTGHRITLRELRGRKVVLYFYPRAFTPGCTQETRRFRDNYDDLRALGAEVVGISVDTFDTQCRFSTRNEVTFPLIGDTDGAIARAYGVLRDLLPWTKRVTFIVDEHGVVRAMFHHEFQVLRHFDDVLEFLERAADRFAEPRRGG